MQSRDLFRRCPAILALMALLQHAYAQQAGDAAPSAPVLPQDSAPNPVQDAAVKQELQQVVVTGVASGGTTRKLDAAFSITTATEDQIRQINPNSTADMMKIVPGVTVDSTGGQTGANIEIRGFPSSSDAPYVSILLDGSPIFAPPTLSFLANDSIFRLDDTVERVEILRGGPSVLYSNGQPGATMNFILKEGSDEAQGSVRATYGSGDLERIDLFYGGKLGQGWYGSVGGFYRVDTGIRDAGFPADQGGSMTATVTHSISDRKLLFYVRATDDKNAFYTSVPVLLQPNGTLNTFAGVNPLTWTPMSNETRYFTLPSGTTGDLADGRGARNAVLGFDFNQKIDDWEINNRMNAFAGDQPTIALFSGPSVLSMEAQMSAFVAAANANPVLTAAAGRPAVTGSAMFVDGSGTVDPNTPTIQFGLWDVDKRVRSVTDELRFTREIITDHNLTVGVYLARYSSVDTWSLGNDWLMDLSGRPIAVTLDNGVQATNANGFASGCTYCISDSGNTGNRAMYVADEWKVSEQWKLDAGARFEYQGTSFTFQSPQTPASGFVGNNPLAAYNYGAEMANGPQIKYDETWTLPSFTVGSIYKLAQNASVFARVNEGGQFPFFDQIRGSDPSLPPPVTKIVQAELGFKTAATMYSAFVNLFADRFMNQFQQTRTFAGVPTNSVGGSKTYGLEYEFSLRPLPRMQVTLSGNAEHARYEDFDDTQDPGINGKMVEYQPASQWRLTPSYVIPLGDNSLKLYGTYSFYGPHWDDQQNTDYLPSYYTLDAGALWQIGEKFEFRLSGSNLTNQIGLTGGAAGRSVALPGTPAYATTARSLFGRNIELSARMRF